MQVLLITGMLKGTGKALLWSVRSHRPVDENKSKLKTTAAFTKHQQMNIMEDTGLQADWTSVLIGSP